MQTDLEKLVKKQAKLIEILVKALELILEVHPTRNNHETYVLGVQAIAKEVLNKVKV